MKIMTDMIMIIDKSEINKMHLILSLILVFIHPPCGVVLILHKMLLTKALFVCGFLASQQVLSQDERSFPDGFMFGTATASYQIEGAWDVSDKSENIWDRFTHTTDGIQDGSTGDIADDSYHLFRRDVEILRELGVQFYRFSISWSRLLPSGFADKISEDGKRYYNDLIDELLAYDIQPMITLYHWDLPQRLQDLGGWSNPLIADWFEDYARVIYELYADRVKLWATLNEPGSYCRNGYGGSGHAPGLGMPGIGDYLCAKNSMLAHARAWRVFDQEYRPKFGGINGLTNHLMWFEGETDSQEDQLAAELSHQMFHGIFHHAVYSTDGGWPREIEEMVAARSAAQGYSQSRLPPFTEEEKQFVKGTYDYFGLQYYTSKLVRSNPAGSPAFDNFHEISAEPFPDPSWETTPSSWFQVYAPGLRNSLNYVKDRYNNPQILITENGYSSVAGIEDEGRVRYYRDHLNQVLDAIYLDDVRVTHYTAWSLMDNFEWAYGYEALFGIYEVDYTVAERTRTPRKSAMVYKEIVRTRTIDPSYEPESPPSSTL